MRKPPSSSMIVISALVSEPISVFAGAHAGG
jgi:hypothetical protein